MGKHLQLAALSHHWLEARVLAFAIILYPSRESLNGIFRGYLKLTCNVRKTSPRSRCGGSSHQVQQASACRKFTVIKAYAFAAERAPGVDAAKTTRKLAHARTKCIA